MFQVRDTNEGTLKFATRSKAVVIDNLDPQARGRIKVSSPLLGDESVWIPYLTDANSFSAPSLGDIVFLECEGGYSSHPVAHGNFTKANKGVVPEAFLRKSPTNRGLYTPSGHLFEMDDGTDDQNTSRGIRFTTAGELKKFHIIDEGDANSGFLFEDENTNVFKLDSNTNAWTFAMASGTTVLIDGDNDLMSLTANGGDFLSVSNADGIQMSTPASGGTTASFKSGNVDIFGANQFTALDSGSGQLKIAGGLVALGNDDGELLDLFDQLLDQLITLTTAMAQETHVGNLGYPSAPPDKAGDYAAVTSEIASVIKATLAKIKGSL